MSVEESASRRRNGVFVASVACGVSLLLCAGAGAAWAWSANADSVQRAVVRDEALQAGRSAVVNFNSLDHEDVQGGLDRWERSSAGPLREEVSNGRDEYAEQIEQQRITTSAKVLDAGLAELDEEAGKARMLTVVQVTARAQDEDPAVQRNRYEAELTRAEGTWKLSGISEVPVEEESEEDGAGPAAETKQ